MMSRGTFSFVTMLVINPVVILFYQNCSMVPSSVASQPPVIREVASVKADTAVAKEEVKTPPKACQNEKGACPSAHID